MQICIDIIQYILACVLYRYYMTKTIEMSAKWNKCKIGMPISIIILLYLQGLFFHVWCPFLSIDKKTISNSLDHGRYFMYKLFCKIKINII